MSKLRVSKRLSVIVAAALVVALAAVAGATASSKTAKASDFKMMIISGFGGVASNANPEILQGAQAAADRINKKGGLHGRQIVLTGCSTQNTTTGDAACARQAVDGGYENVMWRSSFAAGSYKITASAGIPSIGNVPTLTGDYTPKLTYPIAETSQNDFLAAESYAVATDKSLKKWAGIGLQNSGSSLTINQSRTFAQKVGGQWMGSVLSSPLPVPDYLPIVQKLIGWNPDIVVCSCSVPHLVALHAASKQLGFTPKVFLGNTGTVTSGVISQFVDGPGVNYKLLGGGGTPDASVANPKDKLITAFRNDIVASGLDKDPVNFSAASMYGWLAVVGLEKLAAKIKGDVTKTSLITAANSVTKKNPIDIYGAFPWAPGSPGPAAVPRDRNGVGWAHVWKDGRYQVVGKYDTWKVLGYRLP